MHTKQIAEEIHQAVGPEFEAVATALVNQGDVRLVDTLASASDAQALHEARCCVCSCRRAQPIQPASSNAAGMKKSANRPTVDAIEMFASRGDVP